MKAYYNEIDPFAALWLRKLVKAGLIADGDVDERSITEVKPEELKKYTQCHFFAGIGTWSYALKMAGWSDNQKVWTGSCPCQPFSSAGNRKGTKDERHLWPAWFDLIKECKPDVIFGEQVSSKDALAWFDIVQNNLENESYAVGAIDSCAAGIGAPHIRQRLYWVADSTIKHEGSAFNRPNNSNWSSNEKEINASAGIRLANSCDTVDLAYPHSSRLQRYEQEGNSKAKERWPEQVRQAGNCSDVDWLANPNNCKFSQIGGSLDEQTAEKASNGSIIIESGQSRGASKELFNRVANTDSDRCKERRSTTTTSGHRYSAKSMCSNDRQESANQDNSRWGNTDWLFCRDGKWRPVESGTFPLANGIAQRMGRLRAYGNAIVAPQAKMFIEAYMEIINYERGFNNA